MPQHIIKESDPQTHRLSSRASIALSDQALDWIIRLNSGDAVPQEQLDWAAWREQSPEHSAAAEEAEALWQGLGPAGSAWGKTTSTRRVTRRAILGGSAALVVAAGFNQLGVLGPHLFADYQTAAAERRDLVLDDGTQVAMNARTAFSGHFDSGQRGATMYRGQALFDIKPQPATPFTLQAGPHRIHSKNGGVDVEFESNKLTVAVLNGEVDVTGGATPITLQANQMLQINGQGMQAQVQAVDAQAHTAWRRGKLIFNNRSLADLATELERYRGGRIVVMGDALAAMKVTGVFDLSDPEGVLDNLGQSLQVQVSRMPMIAVIRAA